MWVRFVLCTLLTLVLAGAVVAQEDMPPMPELDGEIVADGLNGPMGLDIDADGNLLIVDSGTGGEETIEYADPTTFEVSTVPYGNTSRVIKLMPDGTQEEIMTLASVITGQDAVGGARVATLDGTIYVTVGGWQISSGETVSLPNYTAVVTPGADGEVQTVADMWAFELENNPDGTDNVESHPYDIEAGPDGMLYVADAAANDLLRVDPMSGEVELVAVFDALPGVFPQPFRNNELVADPVPTGVAFDSAGNIFVSFLSGAPFIPGNAKVVQVAQDGTVADFAPGLTMLTDLITGPDGMLYATQFSVYTEEGPMPNSGAILRIMEDGTTEVVKEGLPFLTAITFNEAGDAFVAINGIPIPGAGMIVRYNGLTEIAGEPMGMPGMQEDMGEATEEAAQG
ncbi:ScyD/ScyE family protein [Phototrophicus methaneseepsis]|uniref:ScyD/ScyE family protein n=1 Tax=Phototrophicus methaneseepsis TaxID=2710758 RepID=A0A7S8IEQ9_9CHLR|nr:ScyD/ScyE family protein [Phototrophicus methaneseepsis]QPC83955.1 ScyD/ScyE family protein [Phototrophicus methaneseepsis]